MANLLPAKSGKGAPEKSNFAQTCNLLSQYLKERGSFGDINLGINANLEANKGSEASKQPATTLNLLPSIENSVASTTSANIKPMDFFPKFVGFGSPNLMEDSTNKAATDVRKSSKAEPAATAQMTIFYNGQVIVFDDFPADKAKEIFALASKGSSNATKKGFTTSAIDNNKTNTAAPYSASNNARDQGLQLRPHQDNGYDIPIATRASLHRFFEKRKDRVASKAPYQINNPSSPARTQKSEDEKISDHWLRIEEGLSSKQLDLNL